MRKKHKAVTFDAMVKFFIQQYNIPTKKDIEKVYVRLDHLEKLIQSTRVTSRRRAPGKTGVVVEAAKGKGTPTASDVVYDIIRRSKKGLKISEIKLKTEFEDKKLRNILFRLHRTGRLERISRGIYTSI